MSQFNEAIRIRVTCQRCYYGAMSGANQQNTGDLARRHTSRAKRRRQFSLRGVMFLTAIVSAILAFAVRLPAIFQGMLIAAVPICIVVGLLHGANFATSDRRPRLSLIAWVVLGMFFALYSVALFRVLFDINADINPLPPTLGICVMGSCLAVCVYRTYRAYMLIRQPKEAGRGDLDHSQTANGP
jgi:CHASE2 domain-containing sensor protein